MSGKNPSTNQIFFSTFPEVFCHSDAPKNLVSQNVSRGICNIQEKKVPVPMSFASKGRRGDPQFLWFF